MYAVKISSSGRFVSYCDNCWYETLGTTPIYLFTKERANEIAQQMRQHYVYRVEIISEDGTIEIQYDEGMPRLFFETENGKTEIKYAVDASIIVTDKQKVKKRMI